MADGEHAGRWLGRQRASLAGALNRYGERPALVIRLFEWVESKAPMPALVPLGFVICSICLGYMIAAVFGVHVHGLKSTGQLDNSDTFPTANGFWLIAVALWFAGGCLASLGIDPELAKTNRSRARRGTMLFLIGSLVSGAVGVILFAICV
jgi:hypothetical protein